MLPPLDLQGPDFSLNRGAPANAGGADVGAAPGFASLFVAAGGAAGGNDVPTPGKDLPLPVLDPGAEAVDPDGAALPEASDAVNPLPLPVTPGDDGLPPPMAPPAVLPQVAAGAKAPASPARRTEESLLQSGQAAALPTASAPSVAATNPTPPLPPLPAVTPLPDAIGRPPGDLAAAVQQALGLRAERPDGPAVVAEPAGELADGTQRALPQRAVAEPVAAESLLRAPELRTEPQDLLPKPVTTMPSPLAAIAPSANPPPSVAQAAPAAVVPAAIDVAVANADWGDAIGERVLWMAGRGLQTAEIRLNPAELGPLTVSVRIEENQAQVSFTANHALTREAIEQALPRLRDLFAAEGMTLTNADVSEQGVRQGNDGGQRPGAGPGRQTAADGSDDAAEATTVAARRHDGLVDTFA